MLASEKNEYFFHICGSCMITNELKPRYKIIQRHSSYVRSIYHEKMSKMSKNAVGTLGQALGACLGSLAALLSADHDLVGGQSRSSALAIHTVVDSPGTFLYL